MNEKINSAPGKLKSITSKVPQWHLVTNHQNMLYMLAAGMVMGPVGFKGKHYVDPLCVFPGLIALFRDTIKVPADAVSQATSEHKHLLPCIASFNLGELSGPVRLMLRDGRMREVASPPTRKGKDEIAILVRAPLPLTLLSSINFRSPEDKQAFESAAKNVSNVDLSSYRVNVAESLFSLDTDVTWPLPQGQGQLLEDGRDKPPAFGQALGGVLAMLYQAANRSDLGRAIFRLATGAATHADIELVKIDSILAELPNWLSGTEIQGDVPVRLFWGSIQALVKAQMQERPTQPVDVVLEYLENQLGTLQEDKFGSRLERLIKDMRGCFGLSSGTTTELFEHHTGSLSRSLLMFCLREHCIDLLEFSHPLLTDADFIIASILFGVRDTWLTLPREFRRPDLTSYVTHAMVDAEHRKQKTGISLTSPPRRPIPLREIFSSHEGKLTKIQADAALDLARHCHWRDCIQTRITLDDKNYPESFKREGSQLVLPSEVRAEPEIILGRFLNHLKELPLMPHEIESELRRKLDKGNE